MHIASAWRVHDDSMDAHHETSHPAALTELQAAERISLSRAYLRQLRRVGGGPIYVRIGRAIRYLPSDLDAWLTCHRVVDSEAAV